MRTRKKIYGVEEYAADRMRYAKEQSAQPALQATTQAAAPSAPTASQTVVKTQSVAPMTTQPAQTGRKTIPQGAAVSSISTAGNVATQPLTTADRWQMEMNIARNKVYEVLNKKFTYNERSSPLYSILQKQYEREAEKAEGRAYAQSVNNTGGYGSTYATLAGAEARRQTMEGFADQQGALYEAARDEFLQERQSAVDWYNQAKTMYGDAVTQEISDAYDKGIGLWMEARDEEAVRKALKEQGYNDATVNNAILMMQEYSMTADQYAAASNPQAVTQEKVSSGVSYLLEAFDSYQENAMRSMLEASGQYNEAEIDRVMEQMASVYKASVEDAGASVSNTTDAISYKAMLDEALKNGSMTVEEYDAAWEDNSRKIMSSVENSIDDLASVDYASLGIPQEDWDAMEDPDKKLAVINALGQLVESGVVAPWQYREFLANDTQKMMDSKEFKNSKSQTRDMLDRGVIIKDLYKAGYMREDDYISLMTGLIVPFVEKTGAIKQKGDTLYFDLNAGVGDVSGEQTEVIGDIIRFISKTHEDRFVKARAHGSRGGR